MGEITLEGFSNWLDKSRDRLRSIIPPKTISVDRFIDGVICVFTYGRNKDALLKCDQNSIMRAIEKAAEYGLKVNEDGQFLYFTAYKDTCSVILTGRGELALAYRTGKIEALNTGVVCEKDNFDTHDIGMGRVYHSMYLGMEGRGKPIAYWATMSLYNGGKLAAVVTKAEVMEHRDKYSSNWQWAVRNGREDSSIWGKNFDAMAQNLCIKKLLKYFPFDMSTIGIGDTDYYEDVSQDNEEVVQKQVASPQVSEE